MNKLDKRIVLGVLLVLTGVVVFLQNLDIIQIRGLIWGVLFGAAGLAFLSLLVGNRDTNWWAALPGVILLSLGAVIVLSESGGMAEQWAGTVFLAGLGLAFVLVYLMKPMFWWAIIPAGVMLSLAVVTMGEMLPNFDAGPLVLLGIAATFALLALLPNQPARLTWAWWPAGILGLIGVIALSASNDMGRWIGPLVLVVIGAFLLLRGVVRRGGNSGGGVNG